jgi:hypothetical protein
LNVGHLDLSALGGLLIAQEINNFSFAIGLLRRKLVEFFLNGWRNKALNFLHGSISSVLTFKRYDLCLL